MKFVSLLISVFLFVTATAQVEKYLPDPPNPPRLVNDLSGKNLLTEDQRQHLEAKLVAYDDSTSNQIAIVIVDDLHGYSAVEYAVALGRKWGIGGKQFNNGVLVLISTGGQAGNRDAFIATGYGLEGAIPDAIANTILEAELIPNLKIGDYYAAFEKSTDALMKAAAGEYSAPEGYRTKKKKGSGIGRIIVGIVAFFIILIFFGGGNKGGGYMSRRGYRGFMGPTIFPGGGWGSSGGGFGGFGGGGGGFGGFGGGGFGGGGAGGRW